MKNILTLLVFLFSFTLTSFSQTYSTEKKSKENKEYVVFTFKNNTDKKFTKITIKSRYTNGKYLIPRSLTFDVNLNPGDTMKGSLYDYHTFLEMKTNGGYTLKSYEVIFE